MNKAYRLLRYDWPLHFILLLTNWLPDNVPFLRLRGVLASKFFRKCGKNLRLARNLTFYNPSSMHIGSDVYIADGCIFLAIGDISIGDEVIVGPYVIFSAGNHTRYHSSYRFGPIESQPIIIEAGTWIGGHSTILGGAHIKNGCLISSNSAVTRGLIPANSFAAGVPAKVKKQLN